MIPVALLTVFLVVNLIEQDVIAHTPGQPECEQFNSTPRKHIDLNPLGPAQRKEILNTLLACYNVGSNVDIDEAYFRIKDWFDWQLSGLEVATLLGFNFIGRTFIHYGANVNSFAIHIAAWKGNVNMLRILLDLGGDKNLKNRGQHGWNEPPLYWAALFGQTETGALLIERGADVNKFIGSQTPLMVAAGQLKYDMVSLLLSKGARTDLRNNQGKTAEQMVLYLQSLFPGSEVHTKIINLLRNSKG